MSAGSGIWYLEDVNLKDCFCPITHGEEKYNKQPKRHYKKGEFIYFSDDNADKVYFIHSGAVKIAGYTEEGNEMIKSILKEGEIFGELAVFGAEKRSDYAQTVEDSEICMLDAPQVVDLMRNTEGFRKFLHMLMGQRVIYSQKRLESLLFKDAKTRIAEYVLEQSKKGARTLVDGSLVLRNYLTHQEIASYTGTSRQTVTTVLNELREDKILDFNRKQITIKNMEDLRAEAS